MTRPGRPKVPVISRREAIAAALEIIDTHGLDKLSMRSLGARVGVNGMSLYNHFKDKEDILDQVAGLIVEDIGVPDPPQARAGTITTDELAAWSLESATVYRRALLAHPNAIPLFVKGYPTRGRHAVFAREFEVFADVGIDPRYWLAIVRALESLVVGSTLFLAPGHWPGQGPEGADLDPVISQPAEASAIGADDAFGIAYAGMVRSMIERYQELTRTSAGQRPGLRR
jgi:TetR/AcrR family transcriptional regulator, tetracycline repressor protein